MTTRCTALPQTCSSQGFYPQEDEAVAEIIAAFKQKSGKQVEARFHPEGEHPAAIVAALEAGQPPDFAFGLAISNYISEWAFNDRLVDLSDAVGHFSDLFESFSPPRSPWWRRPVHGPPTSLSGGIRCEPAWHRSPIGSARQHAPVHGVQQRLHGFVSKRAVCETAKS